VSDTLEPGLLIKRNIRFMPRGWKEDSIDWKRTVQGSDPPIEPKRLILCRAWSSLIGELDYGERGGDKGGALRADERSVGF
jgi:hypothetical protein